MDPGRESHTRTGADRVPAPDRIFQIRLFLLLPVYCRSALVPVFSYGPGAEKLIHKKEGALRRQISALENDISVWKNNIDFFAASKNADKLKEEFLVKIEKANDQLNSLKEQLKVINSI